MLVVTRHLPVMEVNALESGSSSMSYSSDLSAGLDVARYYLSKSVKDSTKQQVPKYYFYRTTIN